MKSVKAKLFQMGNMKQRQKIYITLVNDRWMLLPKKPKDWNKIKNRKFIIING